MIASAQRQATTVGRFVGAYTALITPFRHGRIDERALRGLVERQIAAGIDGLVPCGTTGEAATMTEREQDRVVAAVVEQAAGRVPVLVGSGGNGTAATIARTRRVRALGADGALVVTPAYNRPSQEGLFAHFAAVAEAVDLPLVLYNVPGRTGVDLRPETVLRLAAMPTIVGIKEASGSLDRASEIVGSAAEGFVLLSGDDSLTLPILAVGGQGVVSVVANIAPGAVARLVDAGRRGDGAAARELHLGLFELCRAMFVETNPVPVKAAAARLGFCSDEVRLPLVGLKAESRRLVEAAVGRCRLIGGEVALAA